MTVEIDALLARLDRCGMNYNAGGMIIGGVVDFSEHFFPDPMSAEAAAAIRSLRAQLAAATEREAALREVLTMTTGVLRMAVRDHPGWLNYSAALRRVDRALAATDAALVELYDAAAGCHGRPAITLIVIATEHPVARRHHRCDNCQCSIEPGTRYERQRNIYDGAPYVWKTHEDCGELAREIGDGYSEDGVPPLCEAEREDIEEWRGTYPHAVCRTELGWELARLHFLRERQGR